MGKYCDAISARKLQQKVDHKINNRFWFDDAGKANKMEKKKQRTNMEFYNKPPFLDAARNGTWVALTSEMTNRLFLQLEAFKHVIVAIIVAFLLTTHIYSFPSWQIFFVLSSKKLPFNWTILQSSYNKSKIVYSQRNVSNGKLFVVFNSTVFSHLRYFLRIQNGKG